jgi:hypothetical protein
MKEHTSDSCPFDGQPHDWELIDRIKNPVNHGRSHLTEVYRCAKCGQERHKLITKQ